MEKFRGKEYDLDDWEDIKKYLIIKITIGDIGTADLLLFEKFCQLLFKGGYDCGIAEMRGC